MPESAPDSARSRLETEKNIWVATTRPDSRVHLTPVWFAWLEPHLYICVSEKSVKARNVAAGSRIALALEDGGSPVICEGTAEPATRPWDPHVCAIFKSKYDWDITIDTDYNLLLKISPAKWLVW